MAYISFQPQDYFNTKLYTGNATTDHAQTGIGFQPDWLWIKERGGTGGHILVDAVRGVSSSSTPYIKTNSAGAEVSSNTNDFIKSLDSDGFTLGADSYFTDVNKNSSTYASWNWKANGQGSSNTDGSINTTYTSANTTSGFSIVKYTGTGSNATVGHGLGAVPKMIIIKCLQQTYWWFVYHSAVGNTKKLNLNTTNDSGSASANYWNNTTPTSSVFSVGTETSVNQSGQDYIAYCFAEKKGFSKFSSFVGNGSTDGVFCYTGFRPAFVVVKKSSEATGQWRMMDSKRSTSNVVNKSVYANLSNAESSDTMLDFTAQGFKMRSTDQDVNKSGVTYIYMAFAESPIVSSNGVPAVAR